MTGYVADALSRPYLYFLLLVAAGGFLVVGELLMAVRELGRTPGHGGATRWAPSVDSPGLGRRGRLALLAAVALLLISAFGTTSASFSSQISGGLYYDVAFPTLTSTPSSAPTPTVRPTARLVPPIAPTLAPKAGPTPTPAPAPTGTADPTPTPTPAPTEAPTPAPTPAPTEAPTPAPTPAPTDTPTPAPTPAPTDTPTPAPTDTPA